MGVIDDVQSAVTKGVASAGRSGRISSIKLQQSELLRKRKDATAQLGASLYEATWDNAELRQGRENLYEAVADLDRQYATLNEEIERIEREASEERARADAIARATAKAETSDVPCPRCGFMIRPGDKFCSGCAMPAQQARDAFVEQEVAKALGKNGPVEDPAPAPVSDGYRCPRCGSEVGPEDRFCMNCGEEIDWKAARVEDGLEVEENPTDEVIVTPSEDVPEPETEPEEESGVHGAAKCPVCGEPLEEDDVFCMHCGARVK